MLKAISVAILVLSMLASSAPAEQKQKLNIKNQKFGPVQTVSPAAIQAERLNKMEKTIADNHKLLVDLTQQVANLTKQLTVVAAQEKAQQQTMADTKSRLQDIQNGLAGLVKKQSDIGTSCAEAASQANSNWTFLVNQVCRK